MRVWVAAAVCGLAGLAGCGGSSGSPSGGQQQQQNQPPTANAGGPYSGVAGTAISFSAAGSSDPQGQALTYAWNFGDSTTGTGVTATHVYAAAGSYTVSLTVTDTSGLTGTATVVAKSLYVDAALTGTVESGTQPVSGAHVYLLAANTTGYGGNGIAASSSNASVSVLNTSLTGASDSVGAYVTTNASGAFTMSGEYTCASGQQMYLYVTGASGAAWMAALGACPGTSGPAVQAIVNEVSTVAAAYAFAGFATDATHVSSSGTALAQVGIANAFLNAANLETLSTGVALATTPAGNGTVPQSEINTLANILASCASGGAQCATLFANATADGTSTGAQPANTATAAINIAHHPGVNVSALYALASGTPPFGGGLSAAPNDWTVAVSYTAAAMANPGAIAIDGSGNIWVTNSPPFNTITFDIAELASNGNQISPLAGYSGSGLRDPVRLAVDTSGNVWVLNGGGGPTEFTGSGSYVPLSLYNMGSFPGGIAVDGNNDVWTPNQSNSFGFLLEFQNGSLISPANGYSSGVTSDPVGIAIDGSNNIWIVNGQFTSNGGVVKMSSAGTLISPSAGYTAGNIYAPSAIAMDSAGDAWIVNSSPIPSSGASNLVELSPSGAALSPVGGFKGGGLSTEFAVAMCIDGAGDIWTANYGSVSEFSSSGVAMSPSTGLANYSTAQGNFATSIAVGPSGDVWLTYMTYNSNTSTVGLRQLVGAGVPVITPIVAGLPATPTADGSSRLGTRP